MDPINNGEEETSKKEISRCSIDVHKVAPPPQRSSFEKLKSRLKETFFPDDPLRQFKGQPSKRKWILAAQYAFPILQWGPNYSLSHFKSDVVSGLTIASLAIPQGISYAKLANLPPIVGLYSSFVPPLVYAVLGSSRDVAVGPVSIASLILGSMLSQQVSPAKDPLLFLQLGFSSTFFAGLTQASLGFLRLGFIIDYLSEATLVGFMAGAAIIVSLQQLKSLLGITHFTKQMGILPVLSSVFHRTTEVYLLSLFIFGPSFLLLFPVPHDCSMKRPKLFWVSAGMPLASVILSTIIVFALKAQNHGIDVVRILYMHLSSLVSLSVSFIYLYMQEGIAVGRTFAALKSYRVDGNKEMMAIGIMNIIGSSTSCYVTTGSFSRSAVNHNAGAKTAVSNVVMSVTVMVTLLLLMPLFRFTPNVVLGAIIVTAVLGLIDLPAARRIWRIDKFDFLVMLASFFGVIFVSVQLGLAIAVGMSIFRMLLQMTRPTTMVLGNIPGTNLYTNLHHYKDAVSVPGFLILSIQAPINFANANYLKERIMRWMADYEADHITHHHQLQGIKQHSTTSLHYVILDMSCVSALDTTGVTLFKDLKKALECKGVELVLVNPIGEVIEKLERAESEAAGSIILRADLVYLTTAEAVAQLSSAINLKMMM
ncbi:unnamed protein product [Linum tenue]|uniref:STAS domain-containing protein n=1 Tax=Linum tenue TaxID=586396 RepID=A0AAV0LCJ7_9ROSI|nr:unnamed protein product [Linum tenue]